MKKKSFNDYKTVKEKVFFLLKNNPKLRDCDNDLIANYIYNEIGQETIVQMSALDLLAKMAFSKLTPFETIRRYRIEIQKIEPNMKGVEFGKRKKKKDIPLFKVKIED
jgi:hypothetical protein